jgi:hypothetical protein
LTYNFVDFGWLHQNTGLGSNNGGYIDPSYNPFGNFLIGATGTLSSGDWDYSEVGVNIGYFVPLTEKFHLNLRTGWSVFDTDVGGSTHEWNIQPGFRWQVSCDFELFAKAYYHVPEHGTANWSGGLGGIYHLNERIALLAGGGWAENPVDGDGWYVQSAIRYKF